MKEVRLNDKMWFGKYKNTRISDIIKSDPTFIQKLYKEGKITLDEKSNKFFESRYGPIAGKVEKKSRPSLGVFRSQGVFTEPPRPPAGFPSFPSAGYDQATEVSNSVYRINPFRPSLPNMSADEYKNLIINSIILRLDDILSHKFRDRSLRQTVSGIIMDIITRKINSRFERETLTSNPYTCVLTVRDVLHISPDSVELKFFRERPNGDKILVSSFNIE